MKEIVEKPSTEKTFLLIDKPKICCVDLEDEVIFKLEENGYNIFNGKMGDLINVPNKRINESVYIKPEYTLPSNFHEYDILILDLNKTKKKEYVLEEHIFETSNNNINKLICKYPTTIFNPKPFVSTIISEKILDISKKDFLQIIFACESYTMVYDSININSNYSNHRKPIISNIYEFWKMIPLLKTIHGKEVKLDKFKNNDLINLLEKHKTDLEYYQSFEHPLKYDSEKQEKIPINNFIPLLRNIHNDIVSFFYIEDNKCFFVFPNIKNKSSFLIELLSNVLPDINPFLFPHSTKFSWLEESEYLLPNHKNLLENKKVLEDKFQIDNNKIEDKIIENHKKFQFLHALISETDDGLVKAVYSFFKWLEFDEVKIMDEYSKNFKEEDLQVELENGILVIETKGIRGTSTDSDCSQIFKIKQRRCEERGSFDVYALYIVNHQRHLPAMKRTNPPFTENQIRDAKNDKRGLLSTWQLFNLYFDIQNGIITKADARKELLVFGLINFEPFIEYDLGTPNHIYKDGFVVTLDINNILLKVGQTLVVKVNNRFYKTKIISIMQSDEILNEVKDFCGEIGLKLDMKISKNTKIFTLSN